MMTKNTSRWILSQVFKNTSKIIVLMLMLPSVASANYGYEAFRIKDSVFCSDIDFYIDTQYYTVSPRGFAFYDTKGEWIWLKNK
jgi:hypothetical protein